MTEQEQIEMWEDRYIDAIKDRDCFEEEVKRLESIIDDIKRLVN
jgi:hypothetical protein